MNPYEDGHTQLDNVKHLSLWFATHRIFDMAFSFLAIIVLLPVCIVLIVAVVIDSWGPPFYISKRLGRGGQEFPLIKIRTMVVGAEELLPALMNQQPEFAAYWKAVDDPRVTRLGRWLRRTSLDEIPQFANVLLGHMAIVGPRPIVEEELAYYSLSEQSLLLSIAPGLTGLWQVVGRSRVPYPERCAIELDYVRRQSFRLDLEIIVRTVIAVARGTGAA